MDWMQGSQKGEAGFRVWAGCVSTLLSLVIHSKERKTWDTWGKTWNTWVNPWLLGSLTAQLGTLCHALSSTIVPKTALGTSRCSALTISPDINCCSSAWCSPFSIYFLIIYFLWWCFFLHFIPPSPRGHCWCSVSLDLLCLSDLPHLNTLLHTLANFIHLNASLDTSKEVV